MQQLANAAVAINSAKTLPEMQATMTKQARRIVGAHQAMSTLRLPDAEHASTCVSLSERYAEYRSLLTDADRFGIGRTVCDTNRPVRLTHAELAEQAGWTAPDAGDDGNLPHRGWLAAPLVARSGANIGVIHLSDRHEGEFTAEDEAVLVQLAQLASVAIENLRLYESARQAARAREQVLAIVSHDLRNPLNAVIMGSTLLLDASLPPEQTKKQLATIRRAAESMNRMIQDLLDVTRMEAGRLTMTTDTVAVREVSREACDMLEPQARERNVALSCDVPDDLPPIEADRDRILQVFSNLIGNAIKFTEPGGRVTVTAACEMADLHIAVSDTGIGIAPEQMAKVMQPFGQADEAHNREHKGTGLGLPLSKGLVELHGGTLALDSVLGEGTTVSIRLPGRARLARLPTEVES
jgi:signal transduction histidine kinase